VILGLGRQLNRVAVNRIMSADQACASQTPLKGGICPQQAAHSPGGRRASLRSVSAEACVVRYPFHLSTDRFCRAAGDGSKFGRWTLPAGRLARGRACRIASP